VFLLWLQLGIGGARVTLAVDDLAQLVAAMAGAAGCWVATCRSQGRIRRAWLLLGCAAFSWGVGEIIWSWYDLIANHRPWPSIDDAFFLLTVPFALAGLLAAFAPPVGWTSRLRAMVDALIVGSAVFLISWLTVLGPVYAGSTGSVFDWVVGLAYPFGDVVILSGLVIVSGRSHSHHRLPLGWIAAGLIAVAVSDSAFAYLSTTNAYGASQLADGGWVIGFFVLGLAGLKPGSRRGARNAHADRRERTLVPYIPVIVAIAIVSLKAVHGDNLGGFGRWNLLAVFLFVVVRQVLTLRENQALTNDLEAKVRARTFELQHSERRLRSLIQNVSDVISVVSHDGAVVYMSPSARDVRGRSDGQQSVRPGAFGRSRARGRVLCRPLSRWSHSPAPADAPSHT
jgi:PAS domain-containing protein